MPSIAKYTNGSEKNVKIAEYPSLNRNHYFGTEQLQEQTDLN